MLIQKHSQTATAIAHCHGVILGQSFSTWRQRIAEEAASDQVTADAQAHWQRRLVHNVLQRWHLWTQVRRDRRGRLQMAAEHAARKLMEQFCKTWLLAALSARCGANDDPN